MDARSSEDDSDGRLLLEEAVPLAHAVVAGIAQERGIPALLIKGPLLSEQKVRPRRTSVDVDCLVAPSRFVDMVLSLEMAGWRAVDDHIPARILPLHSATFQHEYWPCEIDLHHFVPGFFSDAASTFDFLWRRRVEATLANRGVFTTDPVCSMVIAALAAVRDGAKVSEELDSIAQCALGAPELFPAEELLEAAGAVGAGYPLRPFWRRLGITPPRADIGLAERQAWEAEVLAADLPGVRATYALGHTHGRARWRTFLRILRDRGDQMTSETEVASTGPRRLVLARLVEGIRTLPRAAAALWAAQRRARRG